MAKFGAPSSCLMSHLTVMPDAPVSTGFSGFIFEEGTHLNAIGFWSPFPCDMEVQYLRLCAQS